MRRWRHDDGSASYWVALNTAERCGRSEIWQFKTYQGQASFAARSPTLACLQRKWSGCVAR